MMVANVRTRAALLASWHAAQKSADASGAIVLNHASAAGFLIATHASVATAIAQCPPDPWWKTAREYLERAAEEDCHGY